MNTASPRYVTSSALTPEEEAACRAYVVDSRLLAARGLFGMLGEVGGLLTDKELESAFGSGSSAVALRTGLCQALRIGSDGLEAQARHLKTALNKSRLAAPMSLYAGHNDVRVIFGSLAPDVSKLPSLVGHSYSYASVISTSTAETVAEDNARGRSDLSVVMEFQLPTDYPCIDMTQFNSVGGGEFELLVKGGKFQIIDAKRRQLPRLGRPELQEVLQITLKP